MYFEVARKPKTNDWMEYIVETDYEIPNPVWNNISYALNVKRENLVGTKIDVTNPPYGTSIDNTYIFEVRFPNGDKFPSMEVEKRLKDYFRLEERKRALHAQIHVPTRLPDGEYGEYAIMAGKKTMEELQKNRPTLETLTNSIYVKERLNSIFGTDYTHPVSLQINKIIFNKQTTIVFWKDGTKTVVARKKGDKADPESAVAQAIAKKLYKSTSKFHAVVGKYVRDTANDIRRKLDKIDKKLSTDMSDKNRAKLLKEKKELEETLKNIGENYYRGE